MPAAESRGGRFGMTVAGMSIAFSALSFAVR